MPLNWRVVVDQMADVQKLVHLVMRQTDYDEDRIRGELTRQRRRAYEDEISKQARLVGCGQMRGRLTTGQALTELNEMSIRDAQSIVNTYNYDLSTAIQNIKAESPTANRNTYARRLHDWEAKRASWKKGQISQNTEGTARSLAQQDFYRMNGLQGYAVLQPRKAVCPICQGWIDRGEVPLRVAENNPPPYHPNCPHIWQVYPDKVPPEECPLLWVGE